MALSIEEAEVEVCEGGLRLMVEVVVVGFAVVGRLFTV